MVPSLIASTSSEYPAYFPFTTPWAHVEMESIRSYSNSGKVPSALRQVTKNQALFDDNDIKRLMFQGNSGLHS